MGRRSREKALRVTIKVHVLPDAVFDKQFGQGCFAFWNDETGCVALRQSRRGLHGLSDFLHEMKHVWVDCLDTDNLD